MVKRMLLMLMCSGLFVWQVQAAELQRLGRNNACVGSLMLAGAAAVFGGILGAPFGGTMQAATVSAGCASACQLGISYTSLFLIVMHAALGAALPNLNDAQKAHVAVGMAHGMRITSLTTGGIAALYLLYKNLF